MASSKKDLRTNLARARGLGSAKEGLHHWWLQRLTALALIPLSLYFLYSVIRLMISEDVNNVAGWLAQPHAAVMMLLFLVALFTHAKLGVQVIIEDYVHAPAPKYALLVLNSFTCWIFGAISVLAVVRLHFLDLVSSSL